MHQRKAIYTLFIFIQSLIYGIGNPATRLPTRASRLYGFWPPVLPWHFFCSCSCLGAGYCHA